MLNQLLNHLAAVPLILASTSPRRRELLASIELPFTVEPPHVDESTIPVEGLTPGELVSTLACIKAQSVANLRPDHLVIGADTVVVLDGHVMGKPTDSADAVAMLQRLQGQCHTVYTGVSAWHHGKHQTVVETTRVWMMPLTVAQCQDYVATGEPMDKAGAYAIQGVGSVLIERVDGCYFNVVGLPLHRLTQLLQQATLSTESVPRGIVSPTI
jgi:septum formation protein